jgi:RNase H-like domain found in reverse transcriptase
LDIFSEEKAHHFPKSRPLDHKIEIKEGFKPKSFKNYNLTPAEQIKLIELERITKLVLERLWEHNLFLKAKKCKFCQTRIEYLGMIIEEEKISMDAVKLGGIRNWPVPTTLKQTQSFLGFGKFYQKFISHYSEWARPLNNLTKKDKKSTDCQKAFDTMKKQFMEEPVLLMPDQSKPFQIKSDTSKVATDAVLTQLD